MNTFLLHIFFFLFAVAAESMHSQTPSTQNINVCFANREKDPGLIDCGKGYPVLRQIAKQPSTKNLVRAALAEVLQGPNEDERAKGFFTSIPTTIEIRLWRNQVLEYSREHPEEKKNSLNKWRDGDTNVTVTYIRLLKDSVFVEFSHSMRAYGGGSCRVGGILGPIRQTLLQFPRIKKVGFGIENIAYDEAFQP